MPNNLDEEQRLAVLEQYAVLDDDDQKLFDDITKLASFICRTPIALITFVGRDKQWFKSKIGTDLTGTPREIAFCNHAIEQQKVFTVVDAAADERFADNPLVTGEANIRFYAGAPITTPEGYALDTLCVLDTKPDELNDAQKEALAVLSRQVMSLLESRRAKSETERLQKLLDLESERVLNKEQDARRIAEEANRLKDDFLATISHELRAPLNSILGWAKMIATGKTDAAQTTRAAETIVRNARSQSQLIEDLLDISRIISGKMRLDVRPVELPPLIESSVESLGLAASNKNVRVETLIDPRAAAISGDSERLRQIIWNLLTNAIKFTPKGGKVQVRLERVNSHLEFIVSDTGIGLSPEFLPHVFERFRQSDGSTTRSSGGVGLGLAIVKHLVELHGGTISVASDGEGKGTTFTVMLPLRILNVIKEDAPRIHPAVDINIPAEILPELGGVKVLVVDDEEDSRQLLEAFLAEKGARVTLCASASEALEILSSVRPDVIVSDIGMPDEDGYSFIKRVRALKPEEGGQTPAIALTAYARTEDRIRALANGFQMFVTKPLEPVELIAAIGSLIQISRKFS